MFQTLESKYPKFYQFFRLFVVVIASILFAWNLCCFAKTANLFPGGFSDNICRHFCYTGGTFWCRKVNYQMKRNQL